MTTRLSVPRNLLIVAMGVTALVVAAAQEPLASVPGLVTEEITADSAAARAGLTIGDRIVGFDGTPLPSPAALQAAQENTFNRDSVVLSVQRKDQALTLSMPLGRWDVQVRPVLPPTALTLYEEGRAALAARKTDEVITKWTAASRAARDEGDIGAAAWLQGRVGEHFEGQRQWKEARDAHAAALALWKQIPDAAAQSRALIALGRCSENANDFRSALEWYEQAEKVDAAAGHQMWVAGDLASSGQVALLRGDLAAAQSYHSRALEIRDRLSSDSLAVSASLHGLGEVAYTRGDLSVAQEYLDRALSLRQRLAADSLDVAASLQSLGNVMYRRGNHAAARDAYNRALALRERLAPDSLDVATSLNTLGNLGVERGDLPEAERRYGRALEIRARLAPGSLSVATTLSNLGVVTNARGDLVAADAYYRRSLAIREQLAPDSLDVASSLTNLGAVGADRGDVDAADGYFRRSLAIQGRLAPDSLSVALSLFNLGGVSRRRGEFAAADDYYQRSLRIRERLAPNSLSVAISLNHLGQVAHDRGMLPLAQDYQDRALALHERLAPGSPYIAETLNDLGIVARSRGDLAAARGYLGRALAVRERLAPNSLDVAESLNDLGGIALEERRVHDALGLFTRAIDIVESRRWEVRSAEARALLLAQHTESYAGLMRAQLALNHAAAAFETAERSRARSFLEILTEARANIRQGVDASLLERERSIQRELSDKAYLRTQLLSGRGSEEEAAALERQLNALVVEYRELQSELRSRSPRYAALVQPQPLRLTQIQQQLLDDNTLLLEYVLGEEASHLFAVTPTAIRWFELPKRAEIERVARRVCELLMARQPARGESTKQRQGRIARADAEYPAAATALSRMTLGPVAAQLANKRLLIVADGALQYVPFGALSWNDRPLMIDHEIVSLPSASVMAVLRRELSSRPRAEKLVAVLADPVFDSEDSRLKGARRAQSGATALPANVLQAVSRSGLLTDRGFPSRLPFTRDEADAIMALAPPLQSRKAVDFSASRATATSAELGEYRIVHLATHGVLDAEHPELSGIVLSLVDEDGQAQDGFLRLHEVYNLNWAADLVVLSACQTALGKEIKGEGLVGLTRGFMYGGARQVLASLWNVNDGATAQFMKHFYQGLLAQRLSPAAALRAAQTEMWKRKQWRAPYYWAAFVLQGEWK